MEVVYYAARANLRRLLSQYPSWTRQQYAQAVGMSLGWVKKWSKRLREAPPEDEAVLQGQSRARKHPSERISQRVVERILELRDQPPEGLGRTPGPKALLYYLPRDAELAASGERLPRSSRTIYRLLREAGRIRRPLPHLGEPMERPAPMSQWQLDAHSMPLPCPPSATASGSMWSKCSTPLIRAPPSWSRRRCERTSTPRPPCRRSPACCAPMAFPSKSPSTAMCALSAVRKAAIIRRQRSRFCHCLGVAVHICDPHQPQQNGFVERYHRSYQEECLARQRPATLEEVRAVTAQFQQHYNFERPLKAAQLWQSSAAHRFSPLAGVATGA